MEEEVREILKATLSSPAKGGKDLFERIHARFAAAGGFELPEIPREPMREPPIFE
jgi:plasmid stability protein